MTMYTPPIRTKENILVVDDVRTLKFDATTVRRLPQAEAALYSQPWDEVWLDHDLEMSLTYEEATRLDEYNIRPLVRKIEEDAYNGIILPVGIFIIHSANPVGKEWIAQALLPWYTVAVTHAHDWLAFERFPQWARFEDNDWE